PLDSPAAVMLHSRRSRTPTPAPGESPVSPEILRFLYDFDHAAVTRNCAGFTHAESLLAPDAGNCANWVLGHILQNRTWILQMLDEEPLWSDTDGVAYARGSKPLDPAAARDFTSLLADYDVTQERIRAGIGRLAPERLEQKLKPDDKWTLGQSLHFMSFHEGYHAGQLGLL